MHCFRMHYKLFKGKIPLNYMQMIPRFQELIQNLPWQYRDLSISSLVIRIPPRHVFPTNHWSLSEFHESQTENSEHGFAVWQFLEIF